MSVLVIKIIGKCSKLYAIDNAFLKLNFNFLNQFYCKRLSIFS